MQTVKQKKPLRQVFLWGIISLAGYLAVFFNQDAVTTYFTQGGIFAGMVIITALAFSFVHGAFANYLLEVAGIQPLKQARGGDHGA